MPRPTWILAAAATLQALTTEAYPTFEEHLEEHRLNFPASELDARRALFKAAVAKVQAQNSKPGALWVAELNEHSVKTKEEKKGMYGYMKRTGKMPMPTFQGTLDMKSAPTHWDWRDKQPSIVSPVKDQGSCGSCWAFASTAVLESTIALATGLLFDLSPQQIASCTPNPQECGGSGGCGGAIPQLAFNYTAQAGITTEWKYPYLSGVSSQTEACLPVSGSRNPVASVTGYHQLPRNDPLALMQAVLQNPVAISVAASEWDSYKSGIFDGCNMVHPDINHNVALMGFGQEGGLLGIGANYYWLIRNSWGPTFGEKGYIRLLRSPIKEPCGIDNTPLDGFACKSNPPEYVVACGMCGLLSDSAFPIGAHLIGGKTPSAELVV